MAALAEALRVLKPGAPLLAAAVSRYASTFDGIRARALAEPAFAAAVARTVADGEHRNPDGRPEWFTSAHFHHPDELWEELAVAGFDVAGVLAVEGPASFLPPREEAWWLETEERRAALLEAIARVEQEPSVLGAERSPDRGRAAAVEAAGRRGSGDRDSEEAAQRDDRADRRDRYAGAEHDRRRAPRTAASRAPRSARSRRPAGR